MIDDKYINCQELDLFYLQVILRSVLLRFVELCMETPYLCPSKGHKHGCRKVTETSDVELCCLNATLLQ